jgi:alpha-galactosidase/6-phospho-beta-glucosidase family protein
LLDRLRVPELLAGRLRLERGISAERGVERDPVRPLPGAIAAVLRQWVDQIELLAGAIVQRDKQAAILALLADRTIVDLDAGLAMGNELFETHAPYLTEYH